MRKRQFTWSAAAGRVVTASETVLLRRRQLTTCTGSVASGAFSGT